MFPKQVGRYEIRGEIGSNERGEVLRAYDPESNREVALKFVRAQSLYTLTSQRKFTTQMAALQALRHPAILPLIDFGAENNRPFIVTTLMQGNLTERIAGPRASVQEVLDMFLGIASALDFASANGVHHDDIKPNNILFDEENKPYLGDLGIAGVINSLSSVKIPVVNPNYTSPEQVRKRPLTSQSQVYSLAAVLYHVLTGQVLFEGATDMVASFKHTSETPPNIIVLRPDLPKAFGTVMLKALEKNPQNRYPFSTAFVRDLERANGGALRPEDVRREAQIQAQVQPAGPVFARQPSPIMVVPSPPAISPIAPPANRRVVFMIILGMIVLMLMFCSAAFAILLGGN